MPKSTVETQPKRQEHTPNLAIKNATHSPTRQEIKFDSISQYLRDSFLVANGFLPNNIDSIVAERGKMVWNSGLSLEEQRKKLERNRLSDSIKNSCQCKHSNEFWDSLFIARGIKAKK